VISGRTLLYGVVGHPVDHSRSPEMHNRAFAHLRIDAVYVALPVEPEGLGEALAGAHALGFWGLNVTVPHKQEARRRCVAVDEVAARVGAVNTLCRRPNGWEGFNTDALAARSLLAEEGVVPGARALVIGAGGAARAAAWALLELGAVLSLTARRIDAAEDLARALARPGGARPRVGPFAQLRVEASAADVVVNCTSVGLRGGDESLAGVAFRPGQLAVDFVYGETAFSASAALAGARVLRGETILVRQGALAFTLWTGQAAPEPEMAAALAEESS